MDEKQMKCAYISADVVISRAGIGSLSELAELKKPSIIIPLPHSHQEKNAEALSKGIVTIHYSAQDFSRRLQEAVKDLLSDEAKCRELGSTLSTILPTDNGAALASRWLGLR
jgi:UDP-N-acetylglucosamine--N-acetylmuramyl-(pentapeptide) pyrophosphoryl-undecaprenol N-acetylglucosamine transferase